MDAPKLETVKHGNQVGEADRSELLEPDRGMLLF